MFFINNINYYTSQKNNSILSKIYKDIEDIDSINTVYVDSSKISLNLVNKINSISYDSNASVKVLEWTPNKILFNVKSEKPQFLFISDIYYPGWKINENIDIIETNGLFRGIIVPSGNNNFIMEFKPNDLLIGKWSYRISLFIISILLLIGIYKRKKNVQI